MKPYDTLKEFKVSIDVLKDNTLAEYIAERVYKSSKKPNLRDYVRVSKLCQTEQDVLRMLRILKRWVKCREEETYLIRMTNMRTLLLSNNKNLNEMSCTFLSNGCQSKNEK